MKRNRANEQAILWLKSMCADSDSFNAINAENCLAMIDKQRKALVSLGAHFSNLRKQRDRYARAMEEARVWSLREDKAGRQRPNEDYENRLA